MKVSMWTRAAGVAFFSMVGGALSPLASQATCSVNDGSPFQLGGAKQYVIKAASSRNNDEIPKHLANAIRLLTDSPEKIKNEAGRQWLLLRAFAQFRSQHEGVFVLNRGDMGYTTNPKGSQNLLLAVDSAASALEKIAPQCAEAIKGYRQQFYGDVYNKAVASLQANQDDSAATYANLALMVSPADPRPWNVLSSVYGKQNKVDSATMAMERILALAGSDTLYKRIKQQSRYNLAVINLTKAESGAGASKDADISKARGLLEEYLKESPGEPNAAQALARALRLSGDTAAVANLFGDILSTPDKFTADQLFEAGSNAAASGRDEDAVKLFEAGFKKNPNHRNALYNYANALFSMKEAAKMGPAVQRLMTIDPNFERGWRLVAGYWQLRSRAETDAAKRKPFQDSTLYYLDKQSKVNPKVDIVASGAGRTGYQIQGSVSNGGTAAGSWTIKFEILDEAGAVVATREVAVGPIEAGSAMTFSVTVEAPKGVAFRYAPIK
ncbi:FxLYD domain-containing protein [Gemmatimonas phototrophica]|uniref:Tetratricopeptide repeat protein n=1 Tax=Gemmatimonas phototrophica TaxID=1379270 RepID=A0A143BKE1_9BACT|nr:FxLYD domain-containing protein [Gemmatimonas phototrophica]AMW04894.1 hypothetical protein GEMMAAP_08705 [Gemmatimonas phototrophica]